MDGTPTARALRALEVIQGSPGISAAALGERLEVSERAARRYVATLREAGIAIEATRGPYGGYRAWRGGRAAPLRFDANEALSLVMAVLDGHHEVGRSYWRRSSCLRTDQAVGCVVRMDYCC